MSGISTERLIDGVIAGIAAGSGGGVSLSWRLAVVAATSVLAAVAVGFLIAAAYMALAARMTPAAAAALVGAGALVLALALVLGLWIAGRAARRRRAEQSRAAGSQGMALLALLSDEVREHPRTAALAALVAGAVIGANPGLQDDALRLLAQMGGGRGPDEPSA